MKTKTKLELEFDPEQAMRDLRYIGEEASKAAAELVKITEQGMRALEHLKNLHTRSLNIYNKIKEERIGIPTKTL